MTSPILMPEDPARARAAAGSSEALAKAMLDVEHFAVPDALVAALKLPAGWREMDAAALREILDA